MRVCPTLCREASLQQLILDIGNTFCKAGVVDTQAQTCSGLVRIPLARLNVQLPGEVERVVREKRPVREAVICSVVPRASRQACDVLASAGLHAVVLRYSAGFPIEVCYDTPPGPGVDRLAHAFFCLQRYPGVHTVAVSVGTAVTVDMIRGEGVFEGGVIFAGPTLQARSLARKTALLSEPDWRGEERLPLPGHSTGACIRSGIVRATAAALDSLTGSCATLLGGARIVVSGGGWPLVRDYVSFNCEYEPCMTLLGARAWYRKASGR